ncbi:WD40 repeat domain-containing protein [Plantactinospora sonchi]|uniref:WD40 repeat domain-containing protein n=1 Tax=Plantactinospora sonchi TaxID=1544735 RepID=A0ABU7RS29_9ACTN
MGPGLTVALGVLLAGCTAEPAAVEAPTLVVTDLPDQIDGHAVSMLAMAADGRLLAGTQDGYVLLLDTPTAAPRILHEMPGRRTFDVALSSDGSAYAATIVNTPDDFFYGRTDGSVTWQVRHDDDPRPGYYVAVSADGTHAVNLGFVATVFDLSTGAQLRELAAEEATLGSEGGEFTQFTIEGSTVTAVANQRVARWGDSPTAQVFDCFCDPRSSAISPDQRQVAFGTVDGHLLILDATSGKPLLDRTVTAAPNDRVWGVNFVEEGRSVLTGTESGLLTLWDVAGDERIATHTFAGGRVGLVIATGRADTVLVQINYDDRVDWVAVRVDRS